jgi:hypothetical protein
VFWGADLPNSEIKTTIMEIPPLPSLSPIMNGIGVEGEWGNGKQKKRLCRPSEDMQQGIWDISEELDILCIVVQMPKKSKQNHPPFPHCLPHPQQAKGGKIGKGGKGGKKWAMGQRQWNGSSAQRTLEGHRIFCVLKCRSADAEKRKTTHSCKTPSSAL